MTGSGAFALNPIIHAPNRLATMALLAPLQEAEFGFVRDHVGLSDSALSKQISQLEDAGYLKVRKGYIGKRPRTWVALTKTGRTALTEHVKALKSIIEAAERQPGSGTDGSRPSRRAIQGEALGG